MRRRKREDRRRSQRISGSTQQLFRASQRSAFGRQNRGRTVSLFFTNYPDDWSQTAGPKGLIPRLRKRAKRNPGLSLRLGKSSGHFGRKILAG
ncbi:hypothetical protein Ancab_006386, partial [Ancistrocladus abbreviatus]